MTIKIWPSKIKGKVIAPPSKSYTHRAIILGLLAKENSVIKNCLWADDTLYTLSACQSLGAKIELQDKTLKITGTGGKLIPKKKKIFVGLSGTTLRLMTSVACLSKEKIIIDGEKKLYRRPMADLILALEKWGAKIKSTNGYAPLVVKGGNLKGGEIIISGKVSSQFISSLLLVSPFAKKEVVIKIKDQLKSAPYVDITLELMRKFGVEAKNNHYQSFFVKTGQKYKGCCYKVEGDYSSASYFFAAAAISGSKVKVEGLNTASCQADKFFLEILKKMGCRVKWEKESVTVLPGAKLKGIEVAMGNCPDVVQTLAVVAAYAQGETKIKEIAHLRYKETDRITATALELAKMGIKVKTTKNSITILGGQPKGAVIKTYGDHRMALSFAIAALGAKGATVIEQAEVVTKSFPLFFEDLKTLGVKWKKIN